MNNISTVKKITFTAIFAAIATIIMFFEFPMPFLPPFLKVDLSGAVILIAAYVLGLGPAISAALIKDLLHLFSTTTGGSGELADFLMTSTLVIIAYLFYRNRMDRKFAIIGCISGTLAMSVMGMITNKLIIIPFYSQLMPIDAIISACTEVNPLIGSLNGYLMFGVFPFNLLKGAILSVVAIALQQKLGSFIRNTNFRTLQNS